MRRVCAWCKKDLGWVASPGDEEVITHGICEPCRFHLSAQVGMPLRAFLDGLEAPVLLVDDCGRIRTANEQARGLVHKTLEEVEGALGGDVFECEHATRPGGCGETVHCSGCTVRRAVEETHESGTGRLRVPAFLNRMGPDARERLDLVISTEKVGEVVLLRIDEVCPRGS